jgi:hypothetical protein
LQRRDFTRLGDGIAWGWRGGAGSPVLRHRLALLGRAFFRNDEFALESLQMGPEWSLEMKSARRWTVSTTLREERVDRRFEFASASVPVGEYRWAEGRLAYTQPGGALFRGTLAVEGGRFYDGQRIGFSAGPTWSASRYFELNGLYQASRITFGERASFAEQALIQVARVRARVMFSNALSTAFLAQYTSTANLVTVNARLRYNRREGQDFYLVFNDGLNTERTFESGLPLSAGRTLLLKYSHRCHSHGSRSSSNRTGECEMTMPSPAALHHTCFLVRDVERTAQALSDSLGIGPWNVWTIVPAECRVRGEESAFSFRVALAQVGGGTFELLAPHTGKSVYDDHLENHGEGFHHTCLVYPSLEAVREAKAELLRQGREMIQEASAGEVFEFGYFSFPEIGSAVELLYLDAALLPPPEVVIGAGVAAL